MNDKEFLRADGSAAASSSAASSNSDSKSSGYDFGTLWQEITNGIGHIMQSITNGMQVRAKTDQVITYSNLEQQQNRMNVLNNMLSGTKSGSTGFMLIAVLVIGGLLFAAIYVAKMKKK
jgi:hypothetical protein